MFTLGSSFFIWFLSYFHHERKMWRHKIQQNRIRMIWDAHPRTLLLNGQRHSLSLMPTVQTQQIRDWEMEWEKKYMSPKCVSLFSYLFWHKLGAPGLDLPFAVGNPRPVELVRLFNSENRNKKILSICLHEIRIRKYLSFPDTVGIRLPDMSEWWPE